MGWQYIVEHMEDDDDTPQVIPPWVELEYKHMRLLAGPDTHIHFTSLSPASQAALTSTFAADNDDDSSAAALARVSCHTASALDLLSSNDESTSNSNSNTVCLLDPKSNTSLSPTDSFTSFLFGGILGDDPPRDRTAHLRALGFPTRSLGPIQMTTDTALGVTKRVIHDKIPLTKIPYIDHPTITFNAHESVQMPFRYIADSTGNPILPFGMRQLLHQDLNKVFSDI